MKKDTLTNVLLKLTIVLLIVVVSLISFFGIYKRDLNSWKNLLPEYNLSKELGKSRTFTFKVDDSTREKEVKKEESDSTNKDSTNTDSTDTTSTNTDSNSEKKPETIKVPVNEESALTKENYKKSKEMIEKRLKEFGIADSLVSVNEENGSITISTPYDNSSDFVVSLASKQGKIEIVDTETDEVLMDSSLVEDATAFYYLLDSEKTGSADPQYDLGVTLKFNKEGQDKLDKIAKEYIETTDAEGKTTQKTITVKIDGDDKYTSYFSPDATYSYIQVPLHQSVGVKTDEEMKEFNDAYRDCILYQSIIKVGKLPVAYQVEAGTFFESSIGQDFLNIAIIVAIAIIAVVAVIIIVKYKKQGLIVAIIEMGYIAILLLLVRAASVNITLSSFIMIAFMAIINDLLLVMLIKKNKFSEFIKFILNMLPFMITILVFNFANGDINIKSLGSVGVWGVFGFIYTYLVSFALISAGKNGVEKDEK